MLEPTIMIREGIRKGHYRDVDYKTADHYSTCSWHHYPCLVFDMCDEIDKLNEEIIRLSRELRDLKG